VEPLDAHRRVTHRDEAAFEVRTLTLLNLYTLQRRREHRSL